MQLRLLKLAVMNIRVGEAAIEAGELYAIAFKLIIQMGCDVGFGPTQQHALNPVGAVMVACQIINRVMQPAQYILCYCVVCRRLRVVHDVARVQHEVDRKWQRVDLLDDGNTVPFITRYRKDQTSGLDEEQIRFIPFQSFFFEDPPVIRELGGI